MEVGTKPEQQSKEKKLSKKQIEEKEGGTVILTRAATYFDCGIHFSKNKPIQIMNKKVYEYLLNTELFVHL